MILILIIVTQTTICNYKSCPSEQWAASFTTILFILIKTRIRIGEKFKAFFLQNRSTHRTRIHHQQRIPAFLCCLYPYCHEGRIVAFASEVRQSRASPQTAKGRILMQVHPSCTHWLIATVRCVHEQVFRIFRQISF